MLKIKLEIDTRIKKLEDIAVGDLVICKAGFTCTESSGGAGYAAGHIFKVRDITSINNDPEKRIFFGGVRDHGVYGRALTHYIK